MFRRAPGRINVSIAPGDDDATAWVLDRYGLVQRQQGAIEGGLLHQVGCGDDVLTDPLQVGLGGNEWRDRLRADVPKVT